MLQRGNAATLAEMLPLHARATAFVLLLFFPATMVAAPALGTVQAQGPVTVNGASVSTTAAVFPGDKIQTGASGMATVSAHGSMAQLGPDTTAILTDRALDLGCGTAVLTTSIGTMVRVGGITVSPAASGTTKIEVRQINGSITITARENWAVVNDGRLRQTLAPRQSATFERPGLACGVAPWPGVAQGNVRIYLPAAAASVGLAVAAYCSPAGWCSQVSPAGP